MFTRDVRELVAHFDVVMLVGVAIVVVDVFVDPLASLVRGARGCHEVPAGVVRVYRTVVAVVGCAGQRVLVETRLVCRGPVWLAVGVADGELDVSLGSRFVRRRRGVRGDAGFCFRIPSNLWSQIYHHPAETPLVEVLLLYIHVSANNTLLSLLSKGRPQTNLPCGSTGHGVLSR